MAISAVRRSRLKAKHADAANPVRIYQPPRIRAEPIQSLEAERVLVRGNLHDRIGGGVDNRPTGFEMLLPQALDDLGARSPAATQQPIATRGFGKLVNKRLGKAFDELGEVAPLELDRKSTQLPVP